MTQSGRAARVAGAHVVLAGSEPVLYLDRGGRSLSVLVQAHDERLRPALEKLADQVRAGRLGRIGLERVDSEPVVGSELEPLLIELGFRPGPRKLTLSA